MIDKTSKIFIAGRNGLVGSSIENALKDKGYNNIIGKGSKELDLRIQSDAQRFFEEEKPEYVILAAAKVGGIQANIDFPAEFLYDNLMIEANIINFSHLYDVKKLVFLGSSCIYPKNSVQPMKEEYLLSGKLEPTNEGYAISKITGIKLCEYYNKQYSKNFISLMPCNIYGIGDNFDPKHSHVISGLIRRFHDAKLNNLEKLDVWGTGNARREFLYNTDLADAVVFLFENYNESEFINIGSGYDISIRELAYLIKDIVGFKGEIHFDHSKPDGMMQKLLDISKIKSLGWSYKTGLEEGIKKTYEWYLSHL